MKSFLAGWETWTWSAVLLAGAIVLGVICHFVFFFITKKLAQRTGGAFHRSLTRNGRKPAFLVFLLVAVSAVLPALRFPQHVMNVIERIVGLGWIAAIAWLVVMSVDVFGDVIAARYRIDVTDNLTARRVSTHIQVLRRIIAVVVTIVAAALMMMTFPAIRHIGDTMLASAGLAGLVVGLAARSTLSNLLAGIQLALTEPIRIEDAVIVNNEFGWIEEIRTTYVVVRIWDLRRMIVPLTYFIEQPFQNWTRTTADLLSKAFIYADYSVPVEEVRQEFRRILEASGMWDGKVWVLQVSNTSTQGMEMRALMSVPNASVSWDLACHVREKLVAYLSEHYPDSLPKSRLENLPARDDSQPGAATHPPAAPEQTTPANPNSLR